MKRDRAWHKAAGGRGSLYQDGRVEDQMPTPPRMVYMGGRWSYYVGILLYLSSDLRLARTYNLNLTKSQGDKTSPIQPPYCYNQRGITPSHRLGLYIGERLCAGI
jgi:hypothetical protein